MQRIATQFKQGTTGRVTTTIFWTNQLLKQCKMEQQQAVEILRMFWKHFQQNKGLKKRMKHFNIEFETKMQLDKARSEKRKM